MEWKQHITVDTWLQLTFVDGCRVALRYDDVHSVHQAPKDDENGAMTYLLIDVDDKSMERWGVLESFDAIMAGIQKSKVEQTF